jgi:hypothetical protein
MRQCTRCVTVWFERRKEKSVAGLSEGWPVADTAKPRSKALSQQNGEPEHDVRVPAERREGGWDHQDGRVTSKGCVSHNSIPDPVRGFRPFRTLVSKF